MQFKLWINIYLCFSHLTLLKLLTDPWYLEVGESIVDSLNLYTRVEGGYASIRDVTTMELEDHQHSFFLSETYTFLPLSAIWPYISMMLFWLFLLTCSVVVKVYKNVGKFNLSYFCSVPVGANTFIFSSTIHSWPIKTTYSRLKVTHCLF